MSAPVSQFAVLQQLGSTRTEQVVQIGLLSQSSDVASFVAELQLLNRVGSYPCCCSTGVTDSDLNLLKVHLHQQTEIDLE